MGWTLFCLTAKIILISMISSSALHYGRTYGPHSGLMLQDISNACSAISTATSIRPSNVLILLGSSRTKYLAHFSFRLARCTPNICSNFLLCSSSRWIFVPRAGINAIPILLCATLNTVIFGGRAALAFFWRMNGCFPLCGELS